MKKFAPRVLVVDDEPLIRWSVTQALTGRGMEVTQAYDGASTLQRIAHASPFDVVVLDLRMPDVSDLSLLETIRTVSPSTAVVLMTAYGTAEMQQAAIGLGVRQLIDKPFELADVTAAVEHAARQAARDNRRSALRAWHANGSGGRLGPIGAATADAVD